MVAELDETCKKLLSYFYFDGLENKIIAEKMGFANTDTVKSKKYQCFKRLQAAVTSQYNKEDFFN
jgi:DNA-directed RNA polymerase specialized sigma24 family protein